MAKPSQPIAKATNSQSDNVDIVISVTAINTAIPKPSKEAKINCAFRNF